MKDFANRLWGASVVLWMYGAFAQTSFWFKLISCIVFLYFFSFGTSRFEDKQYRKIL